MLVSFVPSFPPAAARPFADLDAAHARVVEALDSLPDAQAFPLPSRLRRIQGSYAQKALNLEARAWTARGVSFARVVRIDGPGTWILNVVTFTDTEAGFAVPLLGIELLVFRGRMHLIVADQFPLRVEDEGLMDTVSPVFDDVGEPPPMPGWATAIFSRRPIFRKPRAEAALARGALAVDAVLSAWSTHARGATPCASPSLAKEAHRRRGAYVRAHAEDEPAHPFLGRAFGESLAAELVDEVLFPKRLREASR